MERLKQKQGIGNRIKMTLAAIAALHAVAAEPIKASERPSKAPSIERVLTPEEQENERLLEESREVGKSMEQSQRQLGEIVETLAVQQKELARKVEEAREQMRKNAANAEPSPFQKNVAAMGRGLQIATELQAIAADIAAGNVSPEKIERIKELRAEQEKLDQETVPLK
jgi:hypothetical protein